VVRDGDKDGEGDRRLAGRVNRERGFGLEGDTFAVIEAPIRFPSSLDFT